MMQILVEPSKTSEDILLKITGELIGKYEVHDITNIFQFVEDTSQVLHEMKLYNNSTPHASQPSNSSSTRAATTYRNSSLYTTLKSSKSSTSSSKPSKNYTPGRTSKPAQFRNRSSVPTATTSSTRGI
jgi:hypothetical protein